MNNRDFLKAIGDIDDKYLIEENDVEERNRITANKMVNIMRKLNLKYVASAILTITIVSIFVFGVNKIKDPNNDIGTVQNDRIIFNNYKIESSGDAAGKWIDADVKSQFEFLNNMAIPESYELVRQGEIYEPANSEDMDYTKLWQYSLIYDLKNTIQNNSIEINFTRENKIISCLLPNEDELPDSIVGGKKVKLFKMENKAEAFFEYNGYKFYIKAHTISEGDFINLIKSIFTDNKNNLSESQLKQKASEIFGNDYCETDHSLEVGGDAITDWVCKICGKMSSNSTTNVPEICDECARTTERCNKCGKLERK